MTVCVFDNPTTMLREAWQDGKVIAHISERLMYTKGFNGYKTMFFGLNVGRDFIPCKVYGDNLAMKDEK
jgi:hypothetical protein